MECLFKIENYLLSMIIQRPRYLSEKAFQWRIPKRSSFYESLSQCNEPADNLCERDHVVHFAMMAYFKDLNVRQARSLHWDPHGRTLVKDLARSIH